MNAEKKSSKRSKSKKYNLLIRNYKNFVKTLKSRNITDIAILAQKLSQIEN